MSRTLLCVGLSTLVACGVVVGGMSGQASMAVAGDKDQQAAARTAAKAAEQARRSIARKRGADAVRHAEAAVTAMPGDVEYRALLGRAYLADGRFVSAAQAFRDVLTLDPANAGAALNLALAQTAQGDWGAARETLAKHSDKIAPADHGLALALAGDPSGAIDLLGAAAREPDATPVVRQNLALALALSDRWREARAVASIDLAPGDVDARIGEWAQFARPRAASDQVASLLGVTPRADQGQPVRLALATTAPQMAAVGAPAPVEAPVAFAEIDSRLAVAEADAPVPAAIAAPAMLGTPRVVFAERSEIVQALPGGYRMASAAPIRVAAAPRAAKAAPSPVADGTHYVQLGAFDTPGVARDAWNRLSRRVSGLRDLQPQGVQANVGGTAFYRLSVGGFARADADRLCRQVRAAGNACFVRGHSGDRLALWARGPALASR